MWGGALTATSAWMLPSSMAVWMARKLEPPPDTKKARRAGRGASAEEDGEDADGKGKGGGKVSDGPAVGAEEEDCMATQRMGRMGCDPERRMGRMDVDDPQWRMEAAEAWDVVIAWLHEQWWCRGRPPRTEARRLLLSRDGQDDCTLLPRCPAGADGGIRPVAWGLRIAMPGSICHRSIMR